MCGGLRTICSNSCGGCLFRLYNCIAADHDLVLVGLAALICAATVVSAFKTFSLAMTYADRRRMWIGFTGASAAAGIWATHFVGMLAYNAPVPISYDIGLTLLSLVLAAAATTTGFALSARDDRSTVTLGGAVIGAGAAGMHFTGMMAMELPGKVTWDGYAIIAAIILGIAMAAASTAAFRSQHNRYSFWLASALLVLAIFSLHFTAMSAVTIVPDPTLAAATSPYDRVVLAMSIAAMTAFGLGAGISALTIEGLRARIAGQLLKLEEEVLVRRLAEEKVKSKQTALLTHQGTIADLMQDDGVRSGSLEQAMRQLTKCLGSGLGVDRAGTILLGKTTDEVLWREVFVVADGLFSTPEMFGTPEHLRLLIKTSPKRIVAVDDIGVPNPLECHREYSFRILNVGSVMHAPIIAHGELVGFMTCTTVARTITWTAEQRVFALAIANLAALVVERHQRVIVEAAAKARAERLARQQVLLNNLIGSPSIRAGDLDAVLGEITAELCREMSVDRVSVRLFSQSGDEHVLTEVYVAKEDRVVSVPRHGKRRYPEKLLAVLNYGAIAVADCATDPLTAGFYATDLEPRRIRAMLHAPIQNGGEIAGVVQCSTYDKPREWFTEDVLLASGIANLVALAAERRLRLKIEQSLREANLAAEEANRAKSLFLANMSHEIRTPMNGVLGMTDLLVRSGLSERQMRLAGTIGESARALLTIINDILDLSRIEGGKLDLDEQEFDLGGCAEDAVELLAEQAHKKGLDLNLFVDEAALGTANADPVRLRQVLVNLIGNAIKFTQRGEVAVQIAPVEGEAGKLRFSVRDTGIGIDPVVQAKLFQPFTQADTSITRRFGGTGLGLSISRHLVEIMGGTMDLASIPGQGSTISFTLPLSVRPLPPSERSPHGKLTERRILVIDDNATNREIITSYLAGSGAVIEAADSADAGMVMLDASVGAGRPVDLVIVDFKLGGPDGIEFARRVKAAPVHAGVRLMMLSSMSWSGDAAEVRAAGIDKLLHKPIRRRELVAGVYQCLSIGRNKEETGGRCVIAASARPKLGLRVLVAEDNPVNQVVAEEYLNSLGCSVVIAENGVQALAALDRETFDVVLMDCQMPEMDGYTATGAIRAREKSQSAPMLPIVAVTANAFEADRKRCLDAGMNGYLSKPYGEEQLAQALLPYLPAAAPLEVKADRADVFAAGNCQTAGKQKAAKKPVVKAKKAAKGPTREAQVKASPAAPKADIVRSIPVVRPDLKAKLQRTYLAHAPQMMSTLTAAVAECNAQALSLAAHSLKASSANVGEAEIAAIAEEIEQIAGRGAASAGDVSRAAALVERIKGKLATLEQASTADQRPIKRA